MAASEHLNPGQFETFYHLTDKRNFKPNPKKVPQDNAISIHQRSRPGLFVTSDVEGWWNGHGYHQPYVAELKVPKGVAQDERWEGEKFIPGEHLHQAQVSRVMPVDAHIREKFGEPGWVEDHHDSAFDTGKSFERTWGVAKRGSVPSDYHYNGPDVRDFTPEQHAEHMKRIRSYRKAQG
jgi:hypothetical protein